MPITQQPNKWLNAAASIDCYLVNLYQRKVGEGRCGIFLRAVKRVGIKQRYKWLDGTLRSNGLLRLGIAVCQQFDRACRLLAHPSVECAQHMHERSDATSI